MNTNKSSRQDAEKLQEAKHLRAQSYPISSTDAIMPMEHALHPAVAVTEALSR